VCRQLQDDTSCFLHPEPWHFAIVDIYKKKDNIKIQLKQIENKRKERKKEEEKIKEKINKLN
jgi:hypothetical protein